MMLNKMPTGIRPIGIGEVLRRIIGKAIRWEIKEDIIESAGCLQVCAGPFHFSLSHTMLDATHVLCMACVLQIAHVSYVACISNT